MATTLALFRRGIISSPRISRLLRGFASDGGNKGESYFEDDSSFASGKTSVTIMNKEQDSGIFMDAFSNMGFKMSNGMRIIGPCAVFPRSVLHWNVKGIEDVNEESLSLFTMLEPKLDILVLGVGDRENRNKFDPKLYTYLKSKKLGLEVLPTDQALATFNFLNAERRYVAGAFIPPNFIEEIGDDLTEVYESMIEYGQDPMLLKSDYYEDITQGPGEFGFSKPPSITGSFSKSATMLRDKMMRKEEREEEKKRGHWKDDDQT